MGRWMTVLVGLFAVSACDPSYSTCYGNYAESEAVVEMSIAGPIFDWELGTAYALSVYALDDDGELDQVMWHIQCGGDNNENGEQFEEQVCIELPIVYGDRPDSPFLDTVNLTRPEALVPGETYQLRVSTMVEEDGPAPESDLPEWLQFVEGNPERDDPNCGSGLSAQTDFVAPGAVVPDAG